MSARILASAAFAACFVATCAPAAMAKEVQSLTYLDPALFNPALDVPAPPARGSAEEAREIEALHRLIATASPERLARANADGKRENPSLFNETVGVDLKTLPATWDLLTLVQSEAGIVGSNGKVLFNRMRPYSIDPTLAMCGQKADPAKPVYRGYPSGHSMVGYSVGWMLARLMPGKADAILARAHDYAMSRQYCGGHFASDTEASHVIGTLAAATLWNDPRLAGKIAAARAELSKY